MKLLFELTFFPDTTMNYETLYSTWIYTKDHFGTLWSISTVFKNNPYHVRRLRYLIVRNKTQEINIYYKLERPVVDFIVNSSPLTESDLFIKKSDEYDIYKTSRPVRVNLELKQWMILLLGKDSLDLVDIESMFMKV